MATDFNTIKRQNVTNLYIVRENDLVLDNQDKKYILKIKDLPTEEKPREKLTKYGPSVLSTSELLAIILNVGTKKVELR